MPVEPVPCTAPEPEPPTPPCCSPGVASTGLCLADSTPIAVLAVTACADCGTVAAAPEMTGWLNLLTGAYTAGPPPAGTEACAGQPQQFEVGQWCDLDAQGDVIAPVLVEYEYDDNGQLVGVRTLTPGGDPYTVTGTLGICAGPVDDVEFVILCDTGTDGTVTEFLRQLTPNGDGTTTRDTLLDGTTAYTPVGRVGTCGGSLVPCGTGTGGTPGVSGPITSGNEELSSVALARPISAATEHEVPGMGALITGGTWHMPATKCGVNTSGQDHGLGALRLPAVPRPICDAGTVKVTIRLNYAQEGPDAGQASTGALFLMYHQPDGSAVQAGGHAFPQNTPAGSTGTREVVATIPADRLAAGEVYAVVSAETWQKSFNVPPKCKAWTFSEWSAEFAYDVTGCPDLPPPPLAQLVKVCPTDPIPVTVEPGKDTEVAVLCNTGEDGTVTQFLRAYQVDSESGQVGVVADTLLDGITPYEPLGEVSVCQPEPCRDTSSTLLCDTAATDLITVFDPANRPNADGWEVVSFTGANAGTGPEAAMPYPARYGTPMGYPALGARADQSAGSNGAQWPGYDAAPVRWVLRKAFQAPEDGVAVAQSVGFRGDGGARVRINGQDAGMYGQWNQPATSGTAQIPVTAGPNTVEIEVRDTNGINNVVGRLDIALPHTTQFMRRQTVDCETGEIVSTSDYTLDGDPYTVTGEVGQCEPVAECCEQAAPEQRVDVETELLCIREEASGDVLRQVLAERVYDDQSGDRLEQRLTDPTTGDPVELPAGAILARCPSPDRITRQICVVSSGQAEFLTNSANATSGLDTDWQWAPNLDGVWYPMYRVAPNPAWTVTDAAPNPAHWVSPHQDKTVCSPNPAQVPNVPGTWYTRASWNLPANVNPDTIRIAATVLNADNAVVAWRLNGGAWQNGGGTLGPPAYAFPPTAVPGGRAGQNQVVVQLLETQPAVTCPNPNQAGMLLHVAATYDFEPRAWTQVIEDGRVYYLDENGDRQETIPDGDRIVPCGGGGECCPQPECRNSSTLLLCDVPVDGEPDPTVTDTAPGPYYPYPTGLAMAGAQALWDGGALTLPPGTGPQPGTTGTVRTLAAKVQAPRPACDTGTAHVAVSVDAEQLGPDTGCAVTGAVRLFNGTTPVATVLPPNNAAVGWSGTLTVEADVPAADLAAGNVTYFVALDTYDDSPQACPGTPRKTSWKLSGVTASVAYEQTGCAPQFLRTVTVDCETGAVLTVTDSTLGGDPYTVTGEAGECTTGGGCCPAEKCRDTSTVLLCDLDPECQAGIEPTATDEPNPASFNNWRPNTTPTWCHLDTPGQGAPVWTGGAVVLGPDTKCATSSGGDTHRVIGVHLAAGSPSLTGTVDVTVSLRVTNNGPNPGYQGDGMFALWDASAGQSRIKYVSVPTSAPVGAVYTLTLTAAVPAAALAAGDIVAILDLETYHGGGPKAWKVDEFKWSAEVPAIECEAQFLRTIVKDCATGATVSVVDTTLDGEPFEVTGDVGQCTPASGGENPQPDPCQANTVIEACRCDDTDGDGVADTDYVELLAVDCEGSLTSIGTYTPDLSAPYTPVAPVPCETGGAPSATGVQAHRVELVAGQTWSASAWPTLQSVTAVARGAGTVTAADGTSTLVAGESVTWSVGRDSDAILTGPLTIGATDGTVAVAFTTSVTL
ncbi:hypothetical protein [Streptomyces atratus]|uniref:hypothetical protein n=1 Tax=Streptomyces atratus TaxID=1893 RepID=UPI0036577A34